MTKLRLFWTTCEGNEWLSEDHESERWNLATIMATTADFIARTRDRAAELSRKWSIEGEEKPDLYPSAECADKAIEREADTYLDRHL